MPEVKFGPYTLVRRIAVGGMAEVFLARPEKPTWDEYVVVKQILPQLAEEPELLQLFFDEARIASRIFHPGIIRILDVGEHEGVHFLAMEYVDGLDLSQLMRLSKDESTGQHMPIGCAIRVAIDLARAVHHAHEAKEPDGTPLEIVHRDVSPQNVLISKRGEVKLGDFGIARATIRAKKTQTGVLRGKIAYVSPEQYLGQRGDRRVDIYAIGVVLYEMIAGRRPFMGEEATLIQEVMTKSAPPLLHFVPSLDPRLADIIDRALARSPEERWLTAEGFANALERLRLDDVQEALAKLAKKALAVRERKLAEEKAQKQRPTMTLSHPSDLVGAQPLPDPKPIVRPTETIPPVPLPPTLVPSPANGEANPSGVETVVSEDPEFEQLRIELKQPAPLVPTVSIVTPAPVVVDRNDFTAEVATVMESVPISRPAIKRPWPARSFVVGMVVLGLFSGWLVSTLRTEDSDAALTGSRFEGVKAARPDIPLPVRPEPAIATDTAAATETAAVQSLGVEPDGDADEELDHPPQKRLDDAPRRIVKKRKKRPIVPVEKHVASVVRVVDRAPIVSEQEEPKGEGELSLDTDPWSYVSVGKKELGVTPLAHIKVPAGKQKVRLENPERGIVRTIVLSIEPNKATAVRIDLTDGKVVRR